MERFSLVLCTKDERVFAPIVSVDTKVEQPIGVSEYIRGTTGRAADGLQLSRRESAITGI